MHFSPPCFSPSRQRSREKAQDFPFLTPFLIGALICQAKVDRTLNRPINRYEVPATQGPETRVVSDFALVPGKPARALRAIPFLAMIDAPLQPLSTFPFPARLRPSLESTSLSFNSHALSRHLSSQRQSSSKTSKSFFITHSFLDIEGPCVLRVLLAALRETNNSILSFSLARQLILTGRHSLSSLTFVDSDSFASIEAGFPP